MIVLISVEEPARSKCATVSQNIVACLHPQKFGATYVPLYPWHGSRKTKAEEDITLNSSPTPTRKKILLYFQVVCPENGGAAVKGLRSPHVKGHRKAGPDWISCLSIP